MALQERNLRQLTNTAIMISPDQFGFNHQTARTNGFQQLSSASERDVRDHAGNEFRTMVDTLRRNDINIVVLPSRTDVSTPDAVFPNNWFSHHEEGKLVLYPMLTPNRRAERQPKNLQNALSTTGIVNTKIINLTSEENQGRILEGTGSLVLDRKNKSAFAMSSQRTTEDMFNIWCKTMGYEGTYFHACDEKGIPIYHTNVVMSIGEGIAVVCFDTMTDDANRKKVASKLISLDKEIVPISVDQMMKFCGNILQMKSTKGDNKIILSETAASAFTDEQKKVLERHGDLVPVHIPVIEQVGGGSARCMLAEAFPKY